MTNASLPLQIPPLFAARRSAPQLGARAALASVDVLVRGDGIVACTLALLLARQGLQVGLVTARTWQTTPVAQAQQMDMTTAVPASSDVRAYLINTTSQQILAAIGQWTAAMDQQAVARMQVQADGVLHTLTLSAEQALGWIVDVPQLEQHLRLACVAEPQIQVLDAATAQNCTARLQVICEGKNSPSRNALGVHMQREYYPQTALAARVRCGLAHGFTARQWFIGDSIVALLPMTAHDGAAQELALVWSQPHAQARHWQQADPAAFIEELERISNHCLGPLQLISARQSWPLSVALAPRWVGPGFALAGDAAHGIHPLAGQGLNLGLGDAADLAQVLAARESWRDLGDVRLLRRYARQRAAVTASMAQRCDALQIVFMQQHPLLTMLRSQALHTAASACERWPSLRAMVQTRWLNWLQATR